MNPGKSQIERTDGQPLAGKRVLVTRSQEQAGELAAFIKARGGEPVEFPVIRLQRPERPEDVRHLDDALNRIGDFDWIVFTSVNGVDYTLSRMRELRQDLRAMHRAKLAAVGPKTQEALLERGLVADLVPHREFQAEVLLEVLLQFVQTGEQVLLPQGDLSRTVLADGLRAFGADVTAVKPYENVLSVTGGEYALEQLRMGVIDAVTFTSSSTVTNLLEALRRLGEVNPAELLNRTALVCIGPITAQTAAAAGLRIRAMANQSTVPSLVDALCDHVGSFG